MEKRGQTAIFWVFLTLFLAMGVVHSAVADVQLTDQNSTINIVTNSSSGMNNWTIDGTDVLNQQWFWYRVGPSGGQSSLDTLPSTYTLVDPATLKASFTGATFVVSATLSLLGGTSGSGNSDLSLQFRINNTGATTNFFHFYEYSNFVLGGVPGDTVQFLNSNAVTQVGSQFSLLETVATGGSGFPAPMHHEANVVANTLNSLTSGSPYVLNDVNSAGPGDVTWAFQWDVPIAPGATSQISKDINIQVPEPAVLSLVLAGIVGLGLLRHRVR
jgi:hypothetical protein